MATPNNPAPVSGPGALSQRTDGGPSQPVQDIPGLPYGEQQEMNQIQGAARMYEDAPPAPGDLFGPTTRPDEPITAGIPSGPGPGPSPQPPADSDQDAILLQKYLPSLRRAANIQGAPRGFKMFVQYLETFNGEQQA